MELNREKIVKALVCCSKHPMRCEKCPYLGVSCCTNEHRKDALALIREQAEEIERLRESGVDYRNIPYIKSEVRADTVRRMQEELVSEPLPFFVYEGERLGTCKRINDVADKLLREVE